MKIVVIGGVAAGAGAAAKARRTDEKAEIIIFEQGEYVSFANCGLPYYVGGTIPERENLILVSPEMFKSRYNIDVRLFHKVTSFDPEKKVVRGESPAGPFEETYDKLVLATGGEPVNPPIPGNDLPGVYNVFTVPDVDKIMAALGAGAKKAVVVGGGFIGLETADELAQRGVDTTLVEFAPQLLSILDPEFSPPLERHLETRGVKVRIGVGLSEVKGSGKAEQAVLSDGSVLDTDMVIMAVGVRPRLQLAKDAGVKMGPAGGIEVDGCMRTNLPDVFAAGDIVESVNLVSGKKIRNSLAGTANKQGRIAGANACGRHMTFRGVVGTTIIKTGALCVAKTGMIEKEAKAQERDYEVVWLPSASNASYYPTAATLILKLIYEKSTGKILGCQGIGWHGVDKRIDVIATAIMGGLTVFDLENLDLCYAPPYGSAKDPVILLGMVASNSLRGEERLITAQDALVQAAEDPDTVILDVRTVEEYEEGHFEGAVNIPLDDLRARMGELDKSKKYLVSCWVGGRAWNACNILSQNGFDAKNVTGGFCAYHMWVDEG
ncbi:MAG: FAD-dependent oxidoreductase [Lachnospiraceae bacterium]|nr:FAD-dependent oxidoreductase [Lachnospiraceae bacterium]